MIRIALIGAGNHSQQHHAAALAQYAADHPDRLQLSAVCDLDRNKAEACAAQFGFEQVYTHYDEMLESINPDGTICVMPVPHIAQVSIDLLKRGMPHSLEKPVGATLAEVDQVRAAAAETGTTHMISVNRRFDPLINRAIAWAKEQGPLRYVRGLLFRHNRSDLDFLSETAIHGIDTLRHVAGEVISVECRTQPGIPNWYHLTFTFESGALGSLEVLPTTGSVEERYSLFGDDYRVEAQVQASPEPKVRCWQAGRLVLNEVPPPDQSFSKRIGAYAETHAFVSALLAGQKPWPDIETIYPSLEIGFRFDLSKRSA